MIDVSMAAAMFYVNKEKRVVTCVINGTERMFMNYVREKLFIDTVCDEWYAKRVKDSFEGFLRSKLYMPNRFVGIARCNPEDEFDEHIGKVIAYQRARKNLYKSFFKRANTYMRILDNYMDETERILNEFGKSITDSDEKTNNLINELLNEAAEDSKEDFS